MNLFHSVWLAAYLVTLQQILMFSVGMYRGKLGKGMGVEDNKRLERMVRRHGNLAENAGIFIVSVALLELFAGPSSATFWLCLVFAVARTLHAIGFSSKYGAYVMKSKGARFLFLAARALGAGLSGLTGIACGVL
ncbi:MAG: MAPEG family protein, partial [Cyanobacteria bacterium P01_F01_bin.153]